MTTPASAGRRIDRALIVGFGALGHRVAADLIAEGVDVLAVRRTAGGFPAGVTGIVGDVLRPLDLELPAVDTVVVTLPPGPTADAYRRALGHIADALPTAPDRTVFVSSTGVFDAETDAVITEAVAPAPVTPRGVALRDGELAAIENFSAVILRPAGIYGPGRDFLIRQVRAQNAVDHGRRTNRIHETDLVRTVLALARADAPPPVLHAVDGHPALMRDVVAFLARELDLPVPPDSGAGEPHGKVIDGGLLARFLGPLQHPSFHSGYAEMLAAATD